MLDLNPDFFKFVNDHASEKPDSLRLKYYGCQSEFDINLAIDQIECRRKTIHKLPDFNSFATVVYPSVVACEQASHEAVAKFHASLISDNCRVADMTAGLGIDSMALAEVAKTVSAFELDSNKAECLEHNCRVRDISNLYVINGDSVEKILSSDAVYDVIFVDPARRGNFNSRVYNFHDCLPDIINIHSELLSKASCLIIKASPLLDISQTLKDIPNVHELYAVSVNGECKEVLLIVVKDALLHLKAAVNIDEKGGIISRFSVDTEKEQSTNLNNDICFAAIDDIAAGNFLYEPDASVMKLSPWTALSRRFQGIKKFDVSSHLFVSETLHPEFPGRILKIERLLDKKSQKSLKNEAFCVATRNYPLSAVELRKKLGVKEGKEHFIYGSRISSTPVLIAATRQK